MGKDGLMETSNAKYAPKVLVDVRRQEFLGSLDEIPSRELYEMIRSHIESHPGFPGRKALSARISQELLKPDADISPVDDELKAKYAQSRIREVPLQEGTYHIDYFNRNSGNKDDCVNPLLLAHEAFDSAPDGSISVSVIQGSLLRAPGGNAYVSANMHERTNGFLIGSLPENFLKNNPMLVDKCPVEIQLKDSSYGHMKNLSVRIVADTDLMSGDAVCMEDDMFSGLDEEYGLGQ